MAGTLDDFQKFRAELNEEIRATDHLGMKRFFALDHQRYQDGPLSGKTKELLGLVASAVLRCDDCITYHLVQCGEAGWTREEIIDALNVSLIVGGSIVIPHLRRAFARMREIPALRAKPGSDGPKRNPNRKRRNPALGGADARPLLRPRCVRCDFLF